MYKYNLKSSHKGDRRKGEYRNCLVCGTKFWVQAALIKIGKGKYHIKECYDKAKNITKKCVSCGSDFKVQAYRNASHCRKCYGENSAWGYIAPRKDARAWQKVRLFILARDNNECQICGSQEQLRGNHIKKFADHPELQLEPTNIITICKSCDFKFVINREDEWESYFNFNLQTRGILYDEFLKGGGMVVVDNTTGSYGI